MIYLGLEVCGFEPNRAAETSSVYRFKRVDLDNSVHARTLVAQGRAAREERTLNLIAVDSAETAQHMAFIDSLRGRLTPFWFPTWNQDLQPVTDQAAGSLTINVLNSEYGRLMFDNPTESRRHLAVIKANRTIFPIQVDFVTPGPSTEQLTLTAPLPVALEASRDLLCFLQLVRLNTDEPVFLRMPNGGSIFSEPVIEVPNEVPT